MGTDSNTKLAVLLEFVRAEGRVCPMPQKWNELWELLPERRRVGVGWEPPLPLILSAWWHASAMQKQERLAEHLRHAADHGALDSVERFLRSLRPDEWAYGDGT